MSVNRRRQRIRSARTYAYIHMYVVISKSYVHYLLVLHLTHAIRQTAHESLRERAYTNAFVYVDIPVVSALHIIAYVIVSAILAHMYMYSFNFYLLSLNHTCIYAIIFNIFSIYLYVYLKYYVRFRYRLIFIYTRRCVSVCASRSHAVAIHTRVGTHFRDVHFIRIRTHQSLAFATIIT